MGKKRKKFEYKDEYIPATRVRENLFSILDYAATSTNPVKINKGDSKVILINEEEYETLVDSLEFLLDEELQKDLIESGEDIKAGRVYPWEKVKKELGI